MCCLRGSQSLTPQSPRCTLPPLPSLCRPWVDPVGKAKFDAWEALKGKSKDEAMAVSREGERVERREVTSSPSFVSHLCTHPLTPLSVSLQEYIAEVERQHRDYA